jgi:predicted GNAT family acetyltransferase
MNCPGKETRMDYIKLPHSIKSKDENGRILAEITFPEEKPGEYNIDHTYVCDDLRGQGVADELVKMAVEQIRGQGGKVRATCSYASDWLRKNGGK